MKKLLIFSILSYLLFTINSNAADENKNKLKIGVLVPLSGEFKEIGRSVLKAIELAVDELNDPSITIYPKDNKGDADGTYEAAKTLENAGVDIVIGPIFYKNLSKINDINNITFISLTNITQNLPKNTIAFGINVESQLSAITNYFVDKKITKTILLLPESDFGKQVEPIIKNQDFKFYKTYSYDTDPQKITAYIEKITNYKQRKINLNSRVKILEKSDLEKDKNELEMLNQKYTLGKVPFKSVLIADFDERLKSVINSFNFADVSNEEVEFFTFNQWFDESLFNEVSFQNLIFPSIDIENFNKFNKKYFKTFNEESSEISILAYDALGLIYFTWLDNNANLKIEKFASKKGFKGLHGEFLIKNNLSHQKLNVYKIFKKKFVKVN